MKVLVANGTRRVYIFENLTECPYEDKKLYAELKGKSVERVMNSIPIAELAKPVEERADYREKKYDFLRKKK